jgi:phosphoglycolate phosphatase
MRRFELLIFDWDGTLADSAAQIVGSMQAAIEALKLPPRTDHEIRDLIGLGMQDVLQRLFPELGTDDLMRLLGSYRQRYLTAQPPEAPLFAGALPALRRLHADGYRLAVATGKSRAGLRRSLEHHQEVRAMLASSRTADETASKPDPLMLKELLEEQELDADRALMVGDTEYDAQMAAAIGMTMVGVACGVHDDGRLRLAGASVVLEYVAHLPVWLSRS